MDENNKPKLIISVSEAKKFLGKEYAHLSDQNMEALILELSALAIIYCTAEKTDANLD